MICPIERSKGLQPNFQMPRSIHVDNYETQCCLRSMHGYEPLLHQGRKQPANLVPQMGDGGIAADLQLPHIVRIPGSCPGIAAASLPLPASLIIPVPPDRGLDFQPTVLAPIHYKNCGNTQGIPAISVFSKIPCRYDPSLIRRKPGGHCRRR